MLEKLREETDYPPAVKLIARLTIPAVAIVLALLCYNFSTDPFIWLMTGIIALAVAVNCSMWSNLREVVIAGIGAFVIVTLVFEVCYVLIEVFY